MQRIIHGRELLNSSLFNILIHYFADENFLCVSIMMLYVLAIIFFKNENEKN